VIKVLKHCKADSGKRFKRGDIVSASEFSESQLKRFLHFRIVMVIEKDPLTPFIGEIKPVIVTGMWKRPDIFDIFGRHTSKLGIDVIVAGSEGETSRKQAESFGFIYLEQPNQPLAAKMNATTIEAMKRGYTHVICVGSDDLLSKELIEEYLRLIREGYHFIGITDFYFYDTETGKASYWGGYQESYRKNHTAGAGRVISTQLLKSWDCMPWDNKLSSYLDTAMQQKLKISTLPECVFNLKEKGLFAVDVKSSTNMTPFEIWQNSSYIDANILKREFNI
jgi:hypothetical protein